MKSFLFSTTKSILYEVGSSKKVGELFVNLGCKRGGKIMLITDNGIRNRNLHHNCIVEMEKCGYEVLLYSNVVADPPESNILEAVELSKSQNVCGVVGFGGGSSMDVAKLVAFLSNKDCQQTLPEIYGIGNCRGNRLPLVQVPTTAGTGSEVTPISIITTGASEKKGIISSQLLPDWAVLDGELTLSLPVSITAATGIDAMVHAIEAYTTRLKKNPLSDLLAKEALTLLGSNLRKVCSPTGSQDPHARGAMLLGSMYAGMAFANAPVGAVHALAYPIGTHFHVPHGLSNSLILPHVLKFNSARLPNNENKICAEMYSTLASLSFPHDYQPLQDCYENANQFGELFHRLAKELSLPTQLREVGIKENDLPILTAEAMKQTRLLPNNFRNVTFDDALRLYGDAY